MAPTVTVAVVSDIHYACDAEQAREDDYELKCIRNPLLRALLRLHRRFVWLRYPLRQNHLLDTFLAQAGTPDLVVANGDYSCDTAFVGVSDAAACESVRVCLEKLRSRFGSALLATLGDHELGKFSFMGRNGGMRLASFRCATGRLGIAPFWRHRIGRYTLMGVTSSLIALPLFQSEALAEELDSWRALREEHMDRIRRAFSELPPDGKVILFCHDPTALPCLFDEPVVRARLDSNQVELTVIGHLHSNLIFRKSCWLSGMPEIRFLGHSVQKMSHALHEASKWRPFHVRLCPSLAGIELLKDGGFLTLHLDPGGMSPVIVRPHRIPREPR